MRDFMNKRKEQKADGTKDKPQKVECKPHVVLTYSCGHRVAAGSLQHNACPACSRQRRQNKRERYHRNQAGRKGRLENGSNFNLSYDAGKEQWTGVLTLGGSGKTFTAEASAVFHLLGLLDSQYRQSCGESPESACQKRQV